MLASALVAAVVAVASLAHQDQPLLLRGTVRDVPGAPIDGANVFLLETLEGALTDAEGRFVIRTARTGRSTLVVRRLGFRPAQQLIELPTADITLTMTAEAATLAPIHVQAGRWTASNDRGATLTTLDVVTTPGAAANVNRAIQTLPGIQTVDEGTALFVRGGDYTETKVLLDGAVLLDATQLRTPTGTFTGTVDPFLLDGIFFSSGGFGARYGNALSGIASLRTLGRPSRRSATASVGLAAISGAVALALPNTVGMRAAANRLDLAAFLRLNGSPHRYEPAPTGHDVSGSISWSYRPSSEIKVFALGQESRLGIGVDEASFGGLFEVDARSGTGIATWRDRVGAIAASASASLSGLTERQGFGAFVLATHLRSAQASAMAEWDAVERRPAIRIGGEWEGTLATFDGAIPDAGEDVAPGAPALALASRGEGDRGAVFAESEWRVTSRLAATTGVRADRSTRTATTTLDPRIALSFTLNPTAALTAAWGIYHQVPDAMFFDEQFGDPGLAPMRATQLIVGAQLDGEGRSARMELYTKRYRELALLTRDHDVVAHGVGTSRGLDLWFKGTLLAGIETRLAYSLVSARRTDAASGIVARAPFDVTNTVTAVLERRWAGTITGSVAYRHATGRPYTPVIGATRDDDRDVWIPAWGAPMSERLPVYNRVDLSASWFRRFGTGMEGVLFWSISNVLDRENVHAYRYSPDYSARVPSRSIFNRAHYFGASITRS